MITSQLHVPSLRILLFTSVHIMCANRLSLCSVCADGFFEQYGRCLACPASHALSLLTMFALFIALCTACSVLFLFRELLPVDVLKLGLSTLQARLHGQPSAAVLTEPCLWGGHPEIGKLVEAEGAVTGVKLTRCAKWRLSMNRRHAC